MNQTVGPRRILVTGSRDWTDSAAIYRALYYQRCVAGDIGIVIVHGAATGADTIADHWGRQFYQGSVTVEDHPADWPHCGPDCRHSPKYRDGKRYCPLAGFRRNQLMVDLGADVCLGFPFPNSRGTQDCMARARKAGIVVQEYPGHPALVITPPADEVARS